MSYFKRNIWMFGVLIGFALFASIMVSFAVVASRHKVELVTDDYYKDGIDFEQQIDKERNTASLDEKPYFNYKSGEEILEMIFPRSIKPGSVQGKLVLYRPDNAASDISVFLTLNPAGIQSIPVSALAKGNWQVKLSWKSNGEEYFQQQHLEIK
jgi:hypothetical protein